MGSSDDGSVPIPRPPSVSSSHLVVAILVIACFASVSAGFVFYASCNGGNSLILFGVATALLGALLYRMGAWATVIPFAIITLCLIGGGWYGATVAGCSL